MNFLSKFFLFWSIFTSIDKNSEKSNITANESEACGSISGHSSTKILNDGDYLFVPKDKLFIRPLSLRINGSFVARNGTVAVCECRFYGQKSRSRSCNLTIDGCPKIILDPKDILRLSGDTAFVTYLNTSLDNSTYAVVNGSGVVCEPLNQEVDLFFNNTYHSRVGVIASMNTNCSILTLRAIDYSSQLNATLHIFAWNATLNDSFYSVTNDLLIVCVHDCGTDDGAGSRCLQISCVFLMVMVFELVVTWNYCRFPLGTKCVIASILYVLSVSVNLLHVIIYMRVGYYDIFVVLYYVLSFLAVVEFGMLPILSSDLTLKFLELTGALEAFGEVFSIKKSWKIAIFNSVCLVIPFVVAYPFRSQEEFSLCSYVTKVSISDLYYHKKFNESVPLFYIYYVVIVFGAANYIILLIHLFWNWWNCSLYLRKTYVICLIYFSFVWLFWIVGYSIVSDNELYKSFWPLYVVAHYIPPFCISSCGALSTLHEMINFFYDL